MKDKKNIIISYILSKGLFFGLGISYILDNAKQNSILSIIIGYIIGGILLYIINKKNIQSLNNKPIGKILSFLLTIIILNIIIISFTVQTINFYLPQTPSLIIALSFILIIIYGSNKEYNSYKRLCELLLYISIPLSIIGILGNITNIDINNYLPLFNNIDISFIKSIIIVVILSISPLIILLINHTISSKELLTGYYLGGLNILLVISTTIGTLGLTLAKSYRYPEYIAFEKINILNFIERIENFLAFTWLIDLICIGIISIKNIKNNKYIISIIITYLTVKYFINIYQNTMFVYHYIFYILLFIILLIYIFSNNQ